MSVRRTALAARRKVVGFSQEGLAERLQVDRATIVRWEKGESLPQPWKRVELAKSLRVSVEQLDELLTEQSPAAAGFESERGVSEGAVKLPVISHMRDTVEELENNRLAEHVRRTFLAGGLAALTLPSLGLDELKHITAAVVNAQRYADGDILAYFKRQLDNCAVNDGRRGPKQSLPIVLGVIAAIEKMATDSKPAIRRELLRVGAHAAEFAGWLYRDVCIPGLANHWRDRAVEWAQISGDATMQGYVLLKKSQAVWDERDAFRMLTLAEAVQEGPWHCP